MKKNKLMKSFLILTLIIIMMSNTLLVSADIVLDASDNTTLISSKIDPELKKIMNEANEDELISVWVWLESIDSKEIDQMMIKEHGMDPAVYKNEARFNKEVLPQIENEIVAKIGHEAAHNPVIYSNASTASAKISLLNPELIDDYEVTPIDEAVSKKYDEYLANKRAIVKREYVNLNKSFIESYDVSEDNILYCGQYSSALIVNATVDKINLYAESYLVKKISFFENDVCISEGAIALNTAGIYGTGGTGTNMFNGSAYTGSGIKIGVIELATFDSTAAMLAGNGNLNVLNNTDGSGNLLTGSDDVDYIDHATMVTSLLVGQSKTVGSYTFRGAVPNASIYIIPIYDYISIVNAVETLIDAGVHVINMSAGAIRNYYDDITSQIDALLANSDVVMIKSAGNEGNHDSYITMPGLAYNIITVGNAKTTKVIGEDFERLYLNQLSEIEYSDLTISNTPYNIHSSSSYQEPDYIPNKPDISAPGTYISYVRTECSIECVSYGTSLSAPIVTGIVAQMMQKNSYFRANPLAVKAALLLGAESSQIAETDNEFRLNTALREKSGAGFISAPNAVRNTYESEYITFTTAQPGNYVVPTITSFYLEAGDTVNAIMTFNKKNGVIITYYGDTDNIDFTLVKTDDQRIVSSGISSHDNVESINYTVTESGYYEFRVNTIRLVNSNYPPEAALVYTVE